MESWENGWSGQTWNQITITKGPLYDPGSFGPTIHQIHQGISLYAAWIFGDGPMETALLFCLFLSVRLAMQNPYGSIKMVRGEKNIATPNLGIMKIDL